MFLFPITTKKIQPTDDLVDVLLKSLKKEKLRSGDIVAIVSKVVSLTERRIVDLKSIQPLSEKAHKRFGTYEPDRRLHTLIHQEADHIFPGEMYATITDGILTATAGIDTSNIKPDHAILWPKNSYQSAEKIRKKIQAATGLRKMGVLIFDSYILPLRRGVTGITLGYSGFQGVEDCRGRKDLYGKKLKVTFRNLADSLAAATTVLTGEASEKKPFVMIRFAKNETKIKFTNKKIRPAEIKIKPQDCLYQQLYAKKSLGHR